MHHTNYFAWKIKAAPAQQEYKKLYTYESTDGDQRLSGISSNRSINDKKASSTSPITEANSKLLAELIGEINGSMPQKIKELLPRCNLSKSLSPRSLKTDSIIHTQFTPLINFL